MYYNLFQLVFSYCQVDLFKDIPSNLYLKSVNTGCVPGCISYLCFFSLKNNKKNPAVFYVCRETFTSQSG